MGLIVPVVNNGNGISMVYPLAILFGELLWLVLLAIVLYVGERWLNKKSKQAILLISGMAIQALFLHSMCEPNILKMH